MGMSDSRDGLEEANRLYETAGHFEDRSELKTFLLRRAK